MAHVEGDSNTVGDGQTTGMEQEDCIYCGNSFDPRKGQGDHVIPAILGEFRGDLRFRGACPECNQRIGCSEQQLLQGGPERLLRGIVKPWSKRGARRGSSRMGSVLGAPTPEPTVDMGDHHALVRQSPDDPRTAFPVDQIVALDGKGSEHRVPVHKGMRPEQLRERLKKSGANEITRIWIHCGPEDVADFRDLAETVYPGGSFTETPLTEPGMHEMAGRIKFTVNDHYFRAVAKIAFHHYLIHNRRRLRGDESGFEALRQFILHGGDIERFFNPSARRFAVPFGKDTSGRLWAPARWCHLLAFDETEDIAVARVQLFAGPEAVLPPHYVTLGKIDTKVFAPELVWGHVYFYYEEEERDSNYAGWVDELKVTRYR